MFNFINAVTMELFYLEYRKTGTRLNVWDMTANLYNFVKQDLLLFFFVVVFSSRTYCFCML